jgi:hypothetical protein
VPASGSNSLPVPTAAGTAAPLVYLREGDETLPFDEPARGLCPLQAVGHPGRRQVGTLAMAGAVCDATAAGVGAAGRELAGESAELGGSLQQDSSRLVAAASGGERRRRRLCQTRKNLVPQRSAATHCWKILYTLTVARGRGWRGAAQAGAPRNSSR